MTDDYRFSVPVSLNEWPMLREFWQKFKESRFSQRILVEEKELEAYFIQALCFPHQVGILLGWRKENLQGVIVVKAVHYDRGAGAVVLASYIAGVYVDPCASMKFSSQFMECLAQWSKDRKHKIQYGHARPPLPGENNYKLAAVQRRYGFKPVYTVVEREVE